MIQNQIWFELVFKAYTNFMFFCEIGYKVSINVIIYLVFKELFSTFFLPNEIFAEKLSTLT